MEAALETSQVAGQEFVEIARRINVGEAGLGFSIGIFEKIGPIDHLFAGGQERQEKKSLPLSRQHDEFRSAVFDPGEIEEIVVLAEVDAGRHGGIAEEDDGPVAEVFHQGGAAALEFFARKAGSLAENKAGCEDGRKHGNKNAPQAFSVIHDRIPPKLRPCREPWTAEPSGRRDRIPSGGSRPPAGHRRNRR